jgi:dolichol-phosphate mannosyltransferase
VIPVINEGERIQRLLSRMRDSGSASAADVIVIDGGSTDGSLEHDRLRALGVKGLLVKTGPGSLSAQLRCAYAFALDHGYEGVITIDGNDKDDPDAIPSFQSLLEEGFDFVQASRFLPGGVGENTPRSRALAITLLHAPLLSLASGFPWTDTTQGFRGYSASLLLDPRVAVFRSVFREYELLAYLSYRAPRLGYRCVEVPTTRRYPVGEVPTKIKGIHGKLRLIATLLRACAGAYNPRRGTDW